MQKKGDARTTLLRGRSTGESGGIQKKPQDERVRPKKSGRTGKLKGTIWEEKGRGGIRKKRGGKKGGGHRKHNWKIKTKPNVLKEKGKPGKALARPNIHEHHQRKKKGDGKGVFWVREKRRKGKRKIDAPRTQSLTNLKGGEQQLIIKKLPGEKGKNGLRRKVGGVG